MKKQTATISTANLADILNLSGRRIQQLVKLGMPRLDRGRFDFKASVNWYVKFMQNALENKGANMADGDVTLWKKEKSRTLTVTAELKELELEKKRSSLVTREDADKVFAEFRKMVRARISTVPAPLAKELLGEKSQVMAQAKIERALEAALTLLATVDGDASAKILADEMLCKS